MTDILVGKIHSVYCEDFVTYVKAIVYPGEFLNVIIGPNGSGKSTIVAAIVLGLGGSPKVLSRSSKIEEYIKNGKDKANIEIKIYKNSSRNTTVFSRSFDSRGKSNYMIDKSSVSLKEYLAAIAKFNIQISNLCQFLPQDRVQDFAKMNCQEILMNTLSSVCTPDILENFEKLKKFRSEQQNSTKGLKESLDKLKEIESRNAQLKEQIDRMNVRKQLQNDITICESKKIWLEYEESTKQIKITKGELKGANLLLEKHQQSYNIAKTNEQQIRNKKEKMSSEIKIEENKLRQISNELEELQNKFEQNENSIFDAKSTLERKIKESVERESDLKKESVMLTGLKTDLEKTLSDVGSETDRKNKQNEFERKLMQHKAEHKSRMETHRGINRKLDEKFTPEIQAIKRKIASLENISDRKLANIRDNAEDVYKAITWLRQNQNIFDGRVYEPMVLELNINDSNNAKYIENVVSARDLLAFTCENKSDMNLLVKHLCNDMGLKISVLHSDAAEYCSYKPNQSIESLRNLGFTSYLIHMLDGPAPILNYLCKNYSIHTMLSGTEEVDNHTNEIPRHVRVYFAGNNKITTLYSKYSGEKSTMRSEITEKGLLSVGVDAREIATLRQKLTDLTKNSDELKNLRSDVEIKLNSLEEKLKEIKNDKKEFERKYLIVEQQKEKIINQKRKIESLKNTTTNIEEEKEKFKNLAKNNVQELIKLEKKKIESLVNYQKADEKYNLSYTKLHIYNRENSNTEQQITELKENFLNSKQLVETIKSTFEKLQGKSEKILKRVKDRCSGHIPTSKNFPYTKEFSKLPKNLNKLNDMILEMQSKVNCMLAENQSVYDEYEARQTQIKQLKFEIQSNTKNATQIVNEMNEVHNEWFSKISNVIEIINSNFGKFMSSMDYVGEIQLYRTDEHEYNSYGIQILVKYRNETKLQALDRFVQSGGERAVAIAVYTLSLQKITHVPFRCVDEINQGMDANNERKIFDMLVEETSQPGHSQYFFITPKLLPNLTYNEYMTIHIVYNGSFTENEEVFFTP